MATVEKLISERYIDVLQHRLVEIDRQIKALEVQKRRINSLLCNVEAVENGISSTLESVSGVALRSSSTGRQTAPQLIIEALRLANGKVLSGKEIREYIGDRVKPGTISQARSSLEKRGIIAREPGGFVLVSTPTQGEQNG